MAKRKRPDPGAIVQKAEALARTGQYNNWLSIEFALRNDGIENVRETLNREWVRDRLDELCAQTRKAKG